MKKMNLLALVMLVAFVAFQATASAEMISGKVASVDSAANSLSIYTTNAETKAEEKVTIAVKTDTTYSGVAALAELKEGQQVSVNADKDASGTWSASSVEAKAAEAAAAAPAAPAAS